MSSRMLLIRTLAKHAKTAVRPTNVLGSSLRFRHLMNKTASSQLHTLRQPLPTNVPQLAMRSFSTDYPQHEVVGMPALSPTMEVGTVAKWNKKEGELVNAGDVVCEIETDKATVDYEAQDEGYLAKILIQEGASDIPVGTPMLIMVEDEGSCAAFASYEAEAAPAATPEPVPVATPAPAAPVAAPVNTGDRIFASPLAKKVAREAGITLAGISGTGMSGRIVNDDVLSFLAGGGAAMQASALDGGVDSPVSEQACAYAAKLTQQKFDVPHYHLSTELKLDNLLQVREQLNAGVSEDEQISVNDLLLRAAALALKKVPEANSSWKDTFIRQYHNAHINVLMSVGGEFVAPVIRNANQIGVQEISKSFRELLDKSENGQLTTEDLAEGTFTVSNVGMYGVKSLSSIVSPNQACSLGLGGIERVIVPNDDAKSSDKFTVASKMTATLACDHRVIDGAVGAGFLSTYKNLVENPMNMLFLSGI